MVNHYIEKPEQRGKLRCFFGREFFIFKRKIEWFKNSKQYVSKQSITKKELPFLVFRHRSFLLRPLKDVDMALQHNKVTNLRLAISKIQGIVIYPKQTFSIWKLVGRPTKRKGYLDGLTLHNGKISQDTGGGLCQLGNLLYWMALHSDLDITERWRHGFDVFPDINRTIPFACGATLSYNYVDLQLTNNTDRIYSINLWLDDEYLNGEIKCSDQHPYSFEVVETDHLIKQQWWGGYTRHNRIWKRKIGKDKAMINEELVAENHAIMMYNPLLPETVKN